MKVKTALVTVGIAIVALSALGILANQVGGIRIRGTAAQPTSLSLSVSEPVLRGDAIAVSWDATEIEADRIAVVYRDQSGERELTEGPAETGTAFVQFPCDDIQTRGTLVLKNSANDSVLASQRITLLPPGRDCAIF